jgi:hypothetical protein
MCKQIKEQADAELAQFQRDLLESVSQMKSSKAARTTVVTPTATDTRAKVDVPKVELKDLQGIAHNAQSKEYRDRLDRI